MDFIHLDVDTSSFRIQHFPSVLWQISPCCCCSQISCFTLKLLWGREDWLSQSHFCTWRSRSREHLQPPYTPHSISLPIFVGGVVCVFFSTGAIKRLFLSFFHFWSRKFSLEHYSRRVEKNKKTKQSSAMCGIMFPRERECAVYFWSEINCGMRIMKS